MQKTKVATDKHREKREKHKSTKQVKITWWDFFPPYLLCLEIEPGGR